MLILWTYRINFYLFLYQLLFAVFLYQLQFTVDINFYRFKITLKLPKVASAVLYSASCLFSQLMTFSLDLFNFSNWSFSFSNSFTRARSLELCSNVKYKLEVIRILRNHWSLFSVTKTDRVAKCLIN